MYNLGNFNGPENQDDIFNYTEDEQRKVHTPYVQPQDISVEYSANIKPISEKIQFTSHDLALAKKAKSRKTKTIQDPNNSNKKCGHWSSDQNKRYHWFLELHHQHFFNKHLRRTDRIFKSMASFVETREAEQCRSHHQKMQKKYKYFSKILMSLRLQNYNSQDNDPILFDIRQKAININDNEILTADQLKQNSQNNMEQQISQPIEPKPLKSKTLKIQQKIMNIPTSFQIQNQNSLEQEHKQQYLQDNFDVFFGQRDNSVNNLFNDHYEEGFNINHMELEIEQYYLRDRD